MADDKTRKQTQREAELLEAYSATTHGNYPDRLGKQFIITRDDLLPSGQAAYDAMLKQLGVRSMPIILDAAKDNYDHGTDMGKTDDLYGMGELAKKVPQFFVVPEYHHRWSVSYTMHNKTFKDEDLPQRARITDPALLAENERVAKLFNVEPIPELYYLAPGDFEKYGAKAFSGMTPRGTRFIVLNPNEPLADQLGTLAHEMKHHALGHTDWKHIMARHNAQMEDESDMEIAADMGVMEACRGKELADAYQKIFDRQKQEIEAKYGPGSYTRDMQRAIDPYHPPIEDRIRMLREAAGCAVSHVTGGHEMAEHGAPIGPLNSSAMLQEVRR